MDPCKDSSVYEKKRKPKTIWTTEVDLHIRSPPDPENPEDVDRRDTWESPIEFLLSCISFSVGLGNVWRFPFVAYANGGAAFLIPYLVVLTLIGRPMYYLEMYLGQFSSSGQVKMWNVVPFFKGVGYGTLLATACVTTFYATIMAQTLLYLISSFRDPLPWTTCDRSWGHDLCLGNGSVNPITSGNRSIAELYYTMEAFPQKNSIDDGLGKPDWKLTLCLLVSWILILLSLWKGIKSSGKVAYVTATFPYIIMIILLIRAVTLDGATDGLDYFFNADWEKLLEPGVWYAAVSQCFFSLNVSFGSVIIYSSYNPFRHNIYRDAMIISVTDTFTSILAGSTVFAVLGYLSKQLGVPIQDVTRGGPGLAFISYPEAISKFPVPQLFAVLFFLMILSLGIGSLVSMATAFVTVITDKLPGANRLLVTFVVCCVGFCAGLMYITPGGGFMIDLVDEFGANFVIYILGMAEVIAIAWVYGVTNVEQDMRFMLNRSPGIYWKFCWVVAIPIGLLAILLYKMATYEEFKSGDPPYPGIALVCGWILSGVCLSFVPILAMHSVVTGEGYSLLNKLMNSLKPSGSWGPQNSNIKKEWMQYKESSN